MKKIKILTIILAIILISVTAFLGVYTQVQNRMENQIKDYSYAMDLKGSRTIRLKVNKSNKTTIKDENGKEVEDSSNLTEEQIKEKGYTKEETPYNPEEILTTENYQKAKEIVEKRLKKLRVQNYNIKLNEQTGDIVVQITENKGTDNIVSNLNTTGKFEIIDTETKEVLMNNSDIKLSSVMYGANSSATSATNAGTAVYLNIEFNKEGAKKLEDISNKYVKVENSEENTDGTKETDNENTTKDSTTQESEENKSEENKTEEKTITMKIDDEDIMSTSFDETNKIGKLQLSVGQASTDTDTLQGYIQQASNMASVLDTGNMPIKYDIEENQYIKTDLTHEQLQIIKYIAIGIIVIALIVLSIKYKTNGIIGAISYIGLFAVLMLLIRYANVVITIDGLFGVALVLVLEYLFIYKLLKKVSVEVNIKKQLKEIYKEFITRIIPIAIAIITFCFINWIPVSSFGMIMFWGISLILIYNFAITGSLLKIKAENK